MSDQQIRRRLAAILAADVVGYSRLVATDETGTITRLNELLDELVRPLIEEHGGRIFKLMGDGVLAEFGSVVDAVRCAVVIQRGIAEREEGIDDERRLRVRIGVNLGDVIVGDGGDLYGDGINVAARLESLADPDSVFISRSVRDQIRDKLDFRIEDLGEQQVKNIPRPVRVFRLLDEMRPAVVLRPRRKGKFLALATVLLVVAGSAGVTWWWQAWQGLPPLSSSSPPKLTLPNKPSIAILPFINKSGDSQHEIFADGFSEDLITNIAQSKELFVIDSNSTFTYKGKATKTREVAAELGVRYVLEGSIRRVGENIRITTQLVDAVEGYNVWATRYDEPIDRLFDIQDDLSQEIAARLLGNISQAEVAKSSRKHPSDLSAYDLMLRARDEFNKPGESAKLKARALAEQAIAIDPDYSPAYAVIGETYNSAYIVQWEGPEALDRAFEAALKAVELDPRSSTAHELLGRVFLRRGQHDQAIASLERAIALNPNYARHYASLADALTFSNRPVEAIELLQKFMRLDPFYPPRNDMYLGRAYYFARQFKVAVSWLRKCTARAPRYRPCYMYLAPTLAEQSDFAGADQAVKKLLEISPEFSIGASVEGHLPFVPEAMQFYVSGLRKAGVPN